jgi:hypothetical protein
MFHHNAIDKLMPNNGTLLLSKKKKKDAPRRMHSKSDPNSKLASSLAVVSRFMGTSHVYFEKLLAGEGRE